MDVLTLRGLLTLDKSAYDRGLEEADSEASGFGSKFKKVMGTAAKAGAAAMAASASAVALLGKSSIKAYADTEQLVGGVQKLYGNMGLSVEEYAKSVGKSVDQVNAEWKRNEQAQKLVLDNAKNAYKTAGLSSNQYMEQATSFSAALINSLNGDTVKAAKQTDVAMRAIADNYNTFGGDMGMIQYAFQGFAKQNYTMLDNLKLGYGGTKSEMERLIADANKWGKENGKASDLSIESFSDVVTAIDYIQQKQGIAGTTAREASTTIAGSIGMVKAAWENLVSGLADPKADISQLVKNLVSSVGTAGKNIVPAIQQFAKGFGEALTEIAPMVIKGIPNVLSTIVPILTESAFQLVGVMVQALSTALPQLLEMGVTMITTLSAGVKEKATDFIANGADLVVKFSEFVRNAAGQLVPAALTLIQNLAQGIINNIPTFIQTIPVIIDNFAGVINDNAPKILMTGFSIIKALAEGLIKAIPVLIANIPAILKAIVNAISAFSWISLGKFVINGISKGLKAAGGLLRKAVKSPVNGVKTDITAGFNAAKEKAIAYMTKLKDGVKNKIQQAKDKVKEIVDKIKGFFPINVGKIFKGWIPKIKLFSKKGKDSAETGSSTTHVPFAKAMSQPYMFKRPTEFYAGEAGDEMLYGKTSLMRDISNAVEGSGTGGQQVIVTNYITVEGAENPEDFAERFARKLKLDMRMA